MKYQGIDVDVFIKKGLAELLEVLPQWLHAHTGIEDMGGVVGGVTHAAEFEFVDGTKEMYFVTAFLLGGVLVDVGMEQKESNEIKTIGRRFIPWHRIAAITEMNAITQPPTS